ncbi:MAG: hypothetical protein QY316_04575 [Thermodesulfobacteriota bacterium]|nr:MAG: hypothetical protein QY316_04575 [Thermodesulfobacteriota bacterium]
MAISLTKRFMRELERGVNSPNVVVELVLDGGTVRFGYHGRNGHPIIRFLAGGEHAADGSAFAAGSDELPGVVPALKAVSSLQNRLDPRAGYSTRGQLTAIISGRENFTPIISGKFLKNRRAVRKDGFLAPGFTYPDYAATFSGKIIDWSRKGDELTIVIADDLKDASAKIPVESESRTEAIDYTGMNPVDIMADILINRLGIDQSFVDLGGFEQERDMWLAGWRFDRVLTEPKEANQYLNELQSETNSFIVHDGEKVSLKVFAPPAPWQDVEEWTDRTILEGSFSLKSGSRESFYNRIVVYYDYDESGGDREENFESAIIAADAASQDQSEWNEVSTRVIKSRWMRSLAFSQPEGISGLRVYHVSKGNGSGEGNLFYDSTAMALYWRAPGGLQGEPVRLSQDGKYQVFDTDRNRYIRVIAVISELPYSDASAPVLITGGRGETHAAALAQKLLSRFRDPVATASFEIDMNSIAFMDRFIKPSDLKDCTTDEACGMGRTGWVRNRLMLTSVRPDFSTHKVSVEAVETKMHRRYAFIAACGQNDYGEASGKERAYGFVGGAGNSTGGEDGYYIW